MPGDIATTVIISKDAKVSYFYDIGANTTAHTATTSRDHSVTLTISPPVPHAQHRKVF